MQATMLRRSVEPTVGSVLRGTAVGERKRQFLVRSGNKRLELGLLLVHLTGTRPCSSPC
ncbi:hypothetical protein BQ8482_60134 [Mesorhizobium delmotii]|uniref:Uncharacterized protein n=1 Tax=Mesorhizobium delmotii TaxID=1631247 RepID=A0A2P9AVC7_9HYPH|nr:hypothetical protein BQ8482_60134 [Mesorhizobium delmotii]